MAPAEQVNMEVWHRFAAIGTIVDDQTKAGVVNAFLLRDLLRSEEKMAEKRLVFGTGGADADDLLLGNDQNVYGRLRLNIVKSEAKVILINNPGRDFTGNDLGENRAHVLDCSGVSRRRTLFYTRILRLLLL